MLILLTALGMLLHAGCCDICMLPPEVGSCSDSSQAKEELRYYYSAKNLKCTEMPYTGCGGNPNNFKTLEDCTTECGKPLHETSMALSIAAAQKNSKCWYGNRMYNLGESVMQQIAPVVSIVPVTEVFLKSFAPKLNVHSITKRIVIQFIKPGTSVVLISTVREAKDDNNGTALFKCHYKGEEYVEGQTIPTGDYPCILCHCNKNWKGQLTTDGGVCKEIDCGLAVSSPFYFVNKCVPEFYATISGKISCCPISFKCPNSGGDGDA